MTALISTTMVVTSLILLQHQSANAVSERLYSGPRASIALSGSNNVYLTWWDN
jgi:hypothetical protein